MSGMLAAEDCLIGKSVATGKVVFIARVGLDRQFGDRPFSGSDGGNGG